MATRYRWAVLALGVLAQGSFTAYSQGLAALGPFLRSHFEISLVQTGTLLTGVSIGTALTLVAWGAVTDRVGERLVLGAGLGGAGTCLVLAAFAGSFPAVLVLLIAAGMFGACSIAASGRAVLGWFGHGERGTALGVRQMAGPLGAGIAAASLPLIALAYGLRGGLLALAALSLIAALLCGIFIRTPPAADARSATGGRNPLADFRIWRLAIGGSLLVAGQLTLVNYLVLFLDEHRHWAPAAAAAVLAGIQFGGAGSRVLVGVWSDRRGERLALMRLIALAGAATLAAVALLADAPALILVPALLVAGVISMSSNGLGFTATGEIAGQARAATAMGFQNTTLFVTGTVAPIGFAAIVSLAGWQVGFAVLAGLAVAGWVILRPLERLEAAGWVSSPPGSSGG
ncbi:MAG: MFS transporter [Candidatus Dormibacteraceae bacterium]